MRLTALELHGFKSFPDKTRLEFGCGITCVVGPNGSGKSNVSDAIRWVLGEQSTKNLRGAKMEDVIFSGTEQRRSLGVAEVTLHLDNKDRGLNNADSDEVSVTRRLYRSGESEYKINGKTCRLRDVHELFMDTGLGRDGYSLVGQGRIGELIAARSEQRRDMLEEAAGISQSRYRRQSAIQKLAQAEENLLRLRDILLELESRVEPLRRQKEKAEQFLELSAQRKTLEIGLALWQIDQSIHTLRELDHKITKAKTEYALAEQSLEQIETQLQEQEAQAQDFDEQAEELRRQMSALETQCMETQSDIAVCENTIQHNNAAMERLARDASHAADTQQQIEAQMTQASQEAEVLRLAIAESSKAIETAQTEEANLQTQYAALQKESEATAEQLSIAAQRIAHQQMEASAAGSTAAELTARIAQLESAQQSSSAQIEALETERVAAREAFAACQQRVDANNNAMTGYKMRAENRQRKALEQRGLLEELQRKAQQSQTRARLLEDLEQNMEGYTGAVRAVMKESARGALRGLHGSLAQLIHVEADYTVAIETALGASLQHIVCGTQDDAKRAILFLQRSNAGRTTFLPTEVIRAQEFRETGLQKCEGFVAMADALVACDTIYKEIVRAQLGRTVVASNMDTAIAMGKKYQNRLRIVTLDGQLINPGGSLTGGSRGQGSGILSRQSEIARLKEELAVMREKINAQTLIAKQAGEEASAAVAAQNGCQGDLVRAAEDLIRQESACGALDQRCADAMRAHEELLCEATALADRLAQLDEDTSAGETRMKELAQEKLRHEHHLATTQSRIEAMQSRQNLVRERINTLRLKQLTQEKDREAKEEILASLKTHLHTQAGQEQRLQKETQDIQEQNAHIAIEIGAKRENIRLLRTEIAEKQDDVDSVLASRKDLLAQNETLRREEKLLSAQKERLGGECARLAERYAAADNARETIAAKLFDDYQITPREAEEQGFTLDDTVAAQQKLAEISGKIRALGNINVDAIEEYKEVAERHGFLKTQIGDVESSKEELTKLIADLTEKMSARFQEQFTKINRNFAESFVALFGGGQAQLQLEDTKDILECAIDIRVQPPGKNVQNIDLLSGGEKGLAAIALLFAILKANPAPFCVFDEVEAALDDVNVTRYARYVRKMTKNTQFILISHRRGTMEEADMLYGVTMQEEGVSKLLEMQTHEIASRLGI
ncbi:MAG: chromosome segregation protein SMC [Oscillospiraceae bacterium]|jgi:chromosome segregation protein|nr:chromosome segregation protein SMC [Oscillospiraceae bacterium]